MSFLRFLFDSLLDCLCVSMFASLDHPECEACYYKYLEFKERQQGKLHIDHIFLYLVFTMLSNACNSGLVCEIHARCERVIIIRGYL